MWTVVREALREGGTERERPWLRRACGQERLWDSRGQLPNYDCTSKVN